MTEVKAAIALASGMVVEVGPNDVVSTHLPQVTRCLPGWADVGQWQIFVGGEPLHGSSQVLAEFIAQGGDTVADIVDGLDASISPGSRWQHRVVHAGGVDAIELTTEPGLTFWTILRRPDTSLAAFEVRQRAYAGMVAGRAVVNDVRKWYGQSVPHGPVVEHWTLRVRRQILGLTEDSASREIATSTSVYHEITEKEVRSVMTVGGVDHSIFDSCPGVS